jgi:hypothetical protein
VSDRFQMGHFLLERCGQQVPIGRVNIGEEMWTTGSSSEGFRWRDVDNRFASGELTLERCERDVLNRQCTARLRSCALQLFNTPTSERNNTLTQTPNQRRGNKTLQASTTCALALVDNKC